MQVLAVLRFELPLPCLLPVPERAPVVAYTPPAGLLMNSDPSSHDGTNSTSAMSTSVERLLGMILCLNLAL